MSEPLLSDFRLWWIDALGDHNHLGFAKATRWFLDPLELGPNDTILDVGCFVGAALRLAARRYRCEGIGLDPDPRFLGIAKTKVEEERLSEQLRFIQGTAEETGLPESSIRVVLSLEAPYHPPEAWRVLKAGGSFCIATNTVKTAEVFSDEFTEHGFRTERCVDVTKEAIRRYERIRERFLEEKQSKNYIQTVETLLDDYQNKKQYYLRWVGSRR